MNNNVLVIVGPTASGKTSLAVEIAKKFNGEIISADSMQIYKNMDIATAKPTKEEQGGVPHHLIDFLSPNEKFSVAKYKELCCKCIDDILKRGKLPIIAGGTGLYVDTVVNNTVFLDGDNEEIRKTLVNEFEEKGIEPLYERLLEIDRESAEKLHLSDVKRIIRALEVYYSTGKTKSQQNLLSHTEKSKYNFCIIGINAHNREVLYDRINRRVDLMVSLGLINEAENFFKNESSSTAVQAIGYKELKPYFDKEATLDEALFKLKAETRHYAKRQLTWFRRNKSINWIYIDENTSLFDSAVKIIESFGVKSDD